MLKQKLPAETIVLRTVLAALLIVVAAIFRLVPHPWNFTPIGAIALFAGATVKDRRIAFLFPLLALFAGDVFVGLHKLIPMVYASVLVNVLIGLWVEKHRSILRIGLAVFRRYSSSLSPTSACGRSLIPFRTHPPASSRATFPASLSSGALSSGTLFIPSYYSVASPWPSAFSPLCAVHPFRPAPRVREVVL